MQEVRKHGWTRQNYAGVKKNVLIKIHALYLQPGTKVEEWRLNYCVLFKSRIYDQDIYKIRVCMNYNHQLGNEQFEQQNKQHWVGQKATINVVDQEKQ